MELFSQRLCIAISTQVTKEGRDPETEMYSVIFFVTHLNGPLSEVFLMLLEVHKERGFHRFVIFLFF